MAISNYSETIKRAEKYYQSGDEFDKYNMIDMYDLLTEDQQKQADKEIIKFLPEWA